MTIDPSANTYLMGKEITMSADPVGMEQTVDQRTRETGIATESGHSTRSVSGPPLPQDHSRYQGSLGYSCLISLWGFGAYGGSMSDAEPVHA